MRLLPSSLALAELHGDAATAEAMRSLFPPGEAPRFMRHAFYAPETAWASLGEEVQGRIRLEFGKGRWMRISHSPLVTGYASRVGKLRAYGNALCQEVAAEFVAAAMEVMP